MYHHFYGLKQSPFPMVSNPQHLFLTESHKEALASMVYGVQERRGFILILGEAGMGKTTLINHILAQDEATIKTALIFTTVTSINDLLRLTLRDLDIPCSSYEQYDMLDALHEYLLKEEANGHTVVLIIDEAQTLSHEVLEELRILSNVETAHGKLLQILLVGLPGLRQKLEKPGFHQLTQRISLVAQLDPLTVQETQDYITHRLQLSGYAGPPLFTPRAVRQVHRASRGIPRLVNVICDKALVIGYGEEAQQIDSWIIKGIVKRNLLARYYWPR